MSKAHAQVVAAIIVNIHNHILITRRPAHSHLGGLWEFPGGHMETNETPEQALQREILEEVDLCVTVHDVLGRESMEYDEKVVHIAFYRCRPVDPEARPRALQVADYRWIALDALDDYAFPKADHRIIRKLMAEGRKTGVRNK
ncbi:MAG: 8-oxo-dGTP diphosphatase MutT [Caldithrix sp.]|nr:8-oxo-dGTP diphosphatase MutT [Caldithrix sp.]